MLPHIAIVLACPLVYALSVQVPAGDPPFDNPAKLFQVKGSLTPDDAFDALLQFLSVKGLFIEAMLTFRHQHEIPHPSDTLICTAP